MNSASGRISQASSNSAALNRRLPVMLSEAAVAAESKHLGPLRFVRGRATPPARRRGAPLIERARLQACRSRLIILTEPALAADTPVGGGLHGFSRGPHAAHPQLQSGIPCPASSTFSPPSTPSARSPASSWPSAALSPLPSAMPSPSPAAAASCSPGSADGPGSSFY
jgi:hypothetical protein